MSTLLSRHPGMGGSQQHALRGYWACGALCISQRAQLQKHCPFCTGKARRYFKQEECTKRLAMQPYPSYERLQKRKSPVLLLFMA